MSLFRSHLFSVPAATTAMYPLSLHDALPISLDLADVRLAAARRRVRHRRLLRDPPRVGGVEELLEVRSEEHTSELQSLTNLVCRLLLEKKKSKNLNAIIPAAHSLS